MDAVGIEGGAQAGDADDGHDGLDEQGDASHVGETDDHAAEDDAHPVELGLHPDDGGLSHEGIIPCDTGGDGGDDEHDPQADAQGHVEAAVADGGIVGFSHLLELGEDGAENDGAEGEEQEREEARGGEDVAGDGGQRLGHDADGAGEPGDETADGAAPHGGEGADEQQQTAGLGDEHGRGAETAEGDQRGDGGCRGADGGTLPGAGGGGVTVMILPPCEEGQTCAELGENGEEDEGPVGYHGNLLLRR